MPATLDKELAFFHQQRASLLEHHANKVALIKDDSLVGIYGSEAEAIRAGLEQLGNVPFLVKRIQSEEKPVIIPSLVLGLLHAG